MEYDVIVIGSGQGGVPFAVRAGAAGKRTLIIERDRLGGTCVNRGCTPTKTMVASARAAHVARNAGRLGVHADNVSVDLNAVVERKERIVREWHDGVVQRLGKADGVTVLHGHARFTGPAEIEAAGNRFTAPIIVINTGARPVVPDTPGLDAVPFLDSTTIMDLRAVPDHLIVLGGGYIGCEFGQMFRRFGASVTIIDHGPHLLGREDTDVSEAIEGVFSDEGIELRLGRNVAGIDQAGGKVSVELDEGPTVSGSHLLVAAGRTPNTHDLGCDSAGIELDARGFIRVDNHYRTSAEGVFAIGDATGGPQFTHTSWDDHRILFDLLLAGRDGRNRTRDDRLIPYVVFTDPQVARVGLSEGDAVAAGTTYELGRLPFGNVARSIEVDETAGIIKVLVAPDSGLVLGAAIVGSEAGELIHVFTALMQAGASVQALVDAEAVHPTFAEGLQSAVMRIARFAL